MLALDVAILPSADVAALAARLSASLPEQSPKGLLLDADHFPHITLAQLFVNETDLPAALESIAEVVQRQARLTLHVSGGARGTSSVWMAIEPSAELQLFHSRLMRAVAPYERQEGTIDAFADSDARPGDVQWVSGYRAGAAFDSFTPHITLGQAAVPPHVRAFDFVADRVAACHLGKFCACRSILKEWRLG